MNKLIITKWNNRILTALFSEKEVLELGLEESSSILGNIYVGKVKRIVKNLNSAFVEFGEGLTGYYSLEDNSVSLLASPFLYGPPKGEELCAPALPGTDNVLSPALPCADNVLSPALPCADNVLSPALPGTDNMLSPEFSCAGSIPSQRLKGGDEIIVQVAKEAIKTKDPVLTSDLNFAGKYVVLTVGKKAVSFSSKIHDRAWKEEIRPRLASEIGEETGVIVRTNGYGMDELLFAEIRRLLELYRKIIKSAAYRTSKSLLYQAEPEYLKSLKGSQGGILEEIITDQQDIYERIGSYLEQGWPEDKKKLRFYQDPLVSLMNLYSLKQVLEQACQKRVWLKSGGYLVIEPTEAMVVIDVNTGKYSGKKNPEDTIRMINLEAAKEICRQLRLRNLSGIIMVDFIDMKKEEDKTLLMEQLRMFAALDPIKTTVVDMTQLNLVELTRKKGKKPLFEQLAGWKVKF